MNKLLYIKHSAFTVHPMTLRAYNVAVNATLLCNLVILFLVCFLLFILNLFFKFFGAFCKSTVAVYKVKNHVNVQILVDLTVKILL